MKPAIDLALRVLRVCIMWEEVTAVQQRVAGMEVPYRKSLAVRLFCSNAASPALNQRSLPFTPTTAELDQHPPTPTLIFDPPNAPWLPCLFHSTAKLRRAAHHLSLSTAVALLLLQREYH
jgi:hypothetical protein